jgi:L-ascorbate metabolism protein UlaG (beta-lactamase superfamily)
MKYRNLEILRLIHSAFKIKSDKVIYIDPFKLPGNQERADFVFITHEHFDHFSIEDLKKICDEKTTIVASALCKDGLKDLTYKEVKYAQPNQEFEIEGIKVETIPAYNINKFREPGKVFHPKNEPRVGYALEIDGVRIYHAGDTDKIEEMKDLKNIDIALLPVSGTYVMTAEEAASAVEVINPKIAIPMHYGAIIGSVEDAKTFKKLSKVQVEII